MCRLTHNDIDVYGLNNMAHFVVARRANNHNPLWRTGIIWFFDVHWAGVCYLRNTASPEFVK